MSRGTERPFTPPPLARSLEILEALAGARVTVVGDAVLDLFEIGEIARVSREAPVLILEHRRTELAPGGAANTAANLAALGVVTTLVGRTGDDDHGRMLRDLLAGRGIDVASLVPEPGWPTPAKTRILAGSPHTAKQQVVRIDRGRRDAPPGTRTRRRLESAVRRARRRGDGIVLADYGYGLVAPELVPALGPGEGPVTLDSRFQLAAFRGIDAATPNLEELERAAGRRLEDHDLAGIAAAGRELRRRLGAAAILVTRGSRGMTLVEKGRPPVHVPVFGSDEIADVTGAGDTVIAAFTAARTAGATWIEATWLADVAGGLVVMKRGTATVSREEIATALEEFHREEGLP